MRNEEISEFFFVFFFFFFFWGGGVNCDELSEIRW